MALAHSCRRQVETLAPAEAREWISMGEMGFATKGAGEREICKEYNKSSSDYITPWKFVNLRSNLWYQRKERRREILAAPNARITGGRAGGRDIMGD